MAVRTEAQDDLRYIRDVMQRSTEFSAISGVGIIAVGFVGIAASAAAAAGLVPPDAWTLYWSAVALVALVAASLLTFMKAKRVQSPVYAGAGRKFLLCMVPALVVGSALTYGLHARDLLDLMPATWLMVYGAGLTAAGTYSVGNLPVFGALFIVLGIVALAAPALGVLLMGVGFGALHLVIGGTIYRSHGG